MSIDERLNPDENVKIFHGVMMCPRPELHIIHPLCRRWVIRHLDLPPSVSDTYVPMQGLSFCWWPTRAGLNAR